MDDNDLSASDTPIVIRAMVTTEPTRAPSKGDRVQAILSLAVDLLKGLAWPILALTVFLLYREPIRRTVMMIPEKLERADKGNIGSLSWEIQQRATERGGTDLARRVGTLSPGAVEELIRTPRDGTMGFVSTFYGRPDTYTIPSDARLKAFRELEAAQLLRFMEPLDDWLGSVKSFNMKEDESMTTMYGRVLAAQVPLTPERRQRIQRQNYELTPKGKQAVEAIVKAVGEQLKSQ